MYPTIETIQLEIVATLRSTDAKHEVEELARCKGKGEIHWPYIRLKPSPPPDVFSAKKKSMSHANLVKKITNII